MAEGGIIIIGGGIGGLMTAIALNKKGIRSSIFEKTNNIIANGAGLALWANATSILNEYDLLNDLLTYGNVLNEMKMMRSNNQLLKVVKLKKLEDKFQFPSIVLLRQDLQKVLLKAIPDDQIQYNKRCVHIEQNESNAIVHFQDGTLVKGDAVIFADGIHSLARKIIFNLPDLTFAGRTSWRGIAEMKNVPLSLDINYEIFGDGRRIGIFPLPNNLAYWYAAVNMNEASATLQTRTIDGVSSHFTDWPEPVQSIFKNTSEERLILTNINYTTHINKLVSYNIALLGDAAHPMTPDLGQGACQAIEDAYVIAECLSNHHSMATAFKNYEQTRIPRVKSIAINSFRVGKLRQMGNPIGQAIRNNLFRYMPEKMALQMLAKNIRK